MYIKFHRNYYSSINKIRYTTFNKYIVALQLLFQKQKTTSQAWFLNLAKNHKLCT